MSITLKEERQQLILETVQDDRQVTVSELSERFDLKPPTILRRWALRVTLPPLVCAYQELNYALIRLGASPALADTPTERAVALARLLPAAAEPARQLVAEYHATAYSPELGDLDVARQAARAIRNLSLRVVIRRLFISEEEQE
jgi:hypothetical protein